jgi:hypothetical protein
LFYKVTSNAAFPVVNITADVVEMTTGFDLHQLLCIHVDGTGIYTVNNDTIRRPLDDIKLLASEDTNSYRHVAHIAIAAKWLFVVLLFSVSFWWLSLWIDSGMSTVGWVLWISSMVDAIAIIISVVVARHKVQNFQFAIGTSTVVYGSLFYAAVLLLSILLGIGIPESSRSKWPSTVLAKLYEYMSRTRALYRDLRKGKTQRDTRHSGSTQSERQAQHPSLGGTTISYPLPTQHRWILDKV